MTESNRRSVGEGVPFGLLAGVIFGIMEIVASMLMGNPPLMPLRLFASVLLGPEAITVASLGTAVVVGLVVHFAVSAFYGLIYGLIQTRSSGPERTRYGTQAWAGFVFGLGVWLVNFQILARLFYPWFMGTPQFLQALLHGLFFGVALALMYAGGERRAHTHLRERHV